MKLNFLQPRVNSILDFLLLDYVEGISDVHSLSQELIPIGDLANDNNKFHQLMRYIEIFIGSKSKYGLDEIALEELAMIEDRLFNSKTNTKLAIETKYSSNQTSQMAY